ncbi:response regulator [Flavobacteriaceae bacterium AU392]|nr:DNA-binding response regulator [Flavobacteriaceae bacterium]RKM82715.1 response regulator [Flavobacteriaceae bacterium AU392]
MLKENITIILADDHPIMRNGTLKLLQKEGYTILASVEDGAKALTQLVEKRPKIALLDIEMPLLNAFEVIKKARESCPNTKFITMTYHKSKGYLLQAISIGVNGYLLKEDGIPEINNCISQVLEDHIYISTSFSETIIKSVEQEFKKIKLLTPTERVVVRLVSKGKSSQEISVQLSMATRTVEKHRSNIISKLGLQQDANIIAKWANEHKIIVDSL